MDFVKKMGFNNHRFLFVILVIIAVYHVSINWIKLRRTLNYAVDVIGERKDVEIYNTSQGCLILLWTNFFSTIDFEFGLGQKPFVVHRCPVYSCFVSNNRSLINQSDAVIFHFRNVNTSDLPDPNLRRSNQFWIFYLLESPDHTYFDLKPFNGFFNWTMTYRLDSDIVNTYGRTRPKNCSKVPRTRGNSTRKLAAWMVSKCQTNSHREWYVWWLRKYVPVDVFGYCSSSGPCNDACAKSIFENYKFYLSFENSLCTDYVTEKFFKVFQHDMVPVVYGLGSYSDLAPPHSYIDVRHFESPKHLARYLMALNANQTAYDEYLEWKSGYEVLNDGPISGFCELCRRLHERNSPKVYNDIYGWWFNGAENSQELVCLNLNL